MKSAEPNKIILVVDDDDIFRDRLVRALKVRGYEAIGCADPNQAAGVAAQYHPARAVIDLRMPDKSGLDVLRDLRTVRPDLKVVMLTGYGNIPTAIEAVRLGALDYLTKPADADQILAAFGQHDFGRGRAPQPRLRPVTGARRVGAHPAGVGGL